MEGREREREISHMRESLKAIGLWLLAVAAGLVLTPAIIMVSVTIVTFAVWFFSSTAIGAISLIVILCMLCS